MHFKIMKGNIMTLAHIFDTHCHYDDPAFSGEAEALLTSMFLNGLAGAVHASTDISSARFGLAMSEKFQRFYASIGIHPENEKDYLNGDTDLLRELAVSSKKVVAIGEIGLDYHYDGYNAIRQKEIFREQIELANELKLPVIVHSRDATGDCMEILRELRPKGVVHCFSGSWETAKEILNLGMYIGFTGVLTFKNAKKAQEVVEKMPLDRLVLETDCPYMAPEPRRGERSYSGLIPFIAQKAGEIRGMSGEEIAVITEKNAKELYEIK